MPDSQLFPWQVSDDQEPLTEIIEDKDSDLKIPLPKYEGLTVNEILFYQWAFKNVGPADENGNVAFARGQIGELNESDLITLCHNFLCLRLGLADWVNDALRFDGDELTPTDSLEVTTPSGQRKIIPLYMMTLIVAFLYDEYAAWLGKPGAALAQMRVSKRTKTPRRGKRSTG